MDDLSKISPFPIKEISSNYPPVNGVVFSTAHVCRKKFFQLGCQKFYEGIPKDDVVRSHRCPVGFDVVAFGAFGRRFAISSMVDPTSLTELRPDLRREFKSNKFAVENLIGWVKSLTAGPNKFEWTDALSLKLKDAMKPFHDIKRIIGSINTNSSLLAKELTNENQLRTAIDNAPEKLKAIYKASEILDLLGTSLDALSNPKLLSAGQRNPRKVYDAFHKMTKILEGEAAEKGIVLRISGNSHKSINAYPHFDLLPFLLIDNAIKYSFKNEFVDITFSEMGADIRISLTNKSYVLNADDLANAFELFFRGKFSSKNAPEGSGVGLYLAKELAKIHHAQITLNFHKQEGSFRDQIQVGNVEVVLRFPNAFDEKLS